jgi:hypothetical protein
LAAGRKKTAAQKWKKKLWIQLKSGNFRFLKDPPARWFRILQAEGLVEVFPFIF